MTQAQIEQAAREYCKLMGYILDYDDKAIAAIAAYKYALTHQWISVEEKLPEKDEDDSNTSIYVLVTDSNNPFGYVWKAYYDYTIKFWYDAISCENLSKHNITHWMSIPTLKGGEE